MRSFLSFFVLALLILFAVLNPEKVWAVTTTTYNEGDGCQPLGATRWASNNTGLLACARPTASYGDPANVCDTPHACQWKMMGGSVTSGTMAGWCHLGPNPTGAPSSAWVIAPAYMSQANAFTAITCECPFGYTKIGILTSVTDLTTCTPAGNEAGSENCTYSLVPDYSYSCLKN